MKFKLISLYIALFWLALFVLWIWVFGVLVRASPVPEFGVGMVGGVIYTLIMVGIAKALEDSIRDVLDEWRNHNQQQEANNKQDHARNKRT